MTEIETSGPTPSATDAPLAGRVVGLRTFPVKSLDGERLAEVQVLASGLQFDRGWAVVDAQGEVVTGRRAPALREVGATVPATRGEGPALVLPGGDASPVRGSGADDALSRVVGEPVRVQAAEGAGIGFNEVAAVHLVSRQSVTAAAERESAAAGEACDVEDPRANVVVDLAAGQELETSWVGREVLLGEAVLRVSKTPKHCLGVYAEVVRPGRVAVDDEVRLR
jgi:uncharacterized protein YcbX